MQLTSDKPTRAFCGGCFLLLALVQLAAFRGSFAIQPASDDFGPPLYDVPFIQSHGIWPLFVKSNHTHNYRPTQSVIMWMFASMTPEKPLIGVRVLHFISGWLFAATGMLWLARLPIGRVGFFAGAAVLFLHPVLVAPTGSIDGFGSTLSAAMVWLAAWFTLRWREHLGWVITATLICFVIACGIKEFAFAMAPLCGLTLLYFRKRRGLLSGMAVGIPLVLFSVLYMILRRHALPVASQADADMRIAGGLHDLIENAACYGAGLLFPGDTIWVYVNFSTRVAAIVAAVMLVFVAFLIGGIAILWRGADEAARLRRWITFILLSLLAASFPACVTNHISEMYLAPVLVPLAMLVAIAAQGWRQGPGAGRVIATLLVIASVVSSLHAIHVKVLGLRNVGERAEVQLHQIIDLLPSDAHDQKIAILFDLTELPPRRTFSVYRMGDEILLVHPMALEWIAPGRHLTLGSYPLGRPDFHADQYDVLLKWDYATQQFERIDH